VLVTALVGPATALRGCAAGCFEASVRASSVLVTTLGGGTARPAGTAVATARASSVLVGTFAYAAVASDRVTADRQSDFVIICPPTFVVSDCRFSSLGVGWSESLRSDERFLLLDSGLRAVRRPALMQAEWPKRNRLLELIEGMQFAEVVGA